MGVEYKLSWDFQYINADESKRLGRFDTRKHFKEIVVAALAPDLPFAKGCFQRVFDNHGAYMYFPNEENHYWHQSYISVVNGLLHSQGVGYIYPLDTISDFAILGKELSYPMGTDENSKARITELMNTVYSISKNRIEKIIAELKLADNVELFDYVDAVGPLGLYEMKRLGMKMRKN